MNFQNMFKNLQSQLSDMQTKQQSEREKIQVVGEAGGGIVKVKLTGNYQWVDLNIEWEKLKVSTNEKTEDKEGAFLTEEDKQLLLALIKVAYDNAKKSVDELSNDGEGGDILKNFPFNAFMPKAGK